LLDAVIARRSCMISPPSSSFLPYFSKYVSDQRYVYIYILSVSWSSLCLLLILSASLFDGNPHIESADHGSPR
jgi:hypothetical protein